MNSSLTVLYPQNGKAAKTVLPSASKGAKKHRGLLLYFCIRNTRFYLRMGIFKSSCTRSPNTRSKRIKCPLRQIQAGMTTKAESNYPLALAPLYHLDAYLRIRNIWGTPPYQMSLR